MNRAVVDMPRSGIRRVAEEAQKIPGCISLTLGEPSFDTPLSIREAAKVALDAGHTHYPPNVGIPALREQIAKAEQTAAGNVLVTCGSTEAIGCALWGVVEPGDEVIVPMPAFGLYQQQLQLIRGVCVPLHTAAHGFQIDPEALARCITPKTKAIVLNSPNNPTGVTYTRESIKTVEDACLAHDLFLIFDAVYDRLAYGPGVPKPTAKRLGDRLITCNAFSKTYAMTGWRVGYCIAEEVVLRHLAKIHAALAVGVSTFSQVGCLGIFDVPTDTMLAEYMAHRDLTYARLLEMGMEVVKPDGAFYAFPSIAKYGLEDDAFVSRLMRERKVAVVPGNCFGTPGFVRVSYCCGREALEEGLDRLKDFLHTLA